MYVFTDRNQCSAPTVRAYTVSYTTMLALRAKVGVRAEVTKNDIGKVSRFFFFFSNKPHFCQLWYSSSFLIRMKNTHTHTQTHTNVSDTSWATLLKEFSFLFSLFEVIPNEKTSLIIIDLIMS